MVFIFMYVGLVLGVVGLRYTWVLMFVILRGYCVVGVLVAFRFGWFAFAVCLDFCGLCGVVSSILVGFDLVGWVWCGFAVVWGFC